MTTDWFHDYALLALRLNRVLQGAGGGLPLLDYRGPREWEAQVAAEPLPAADDLVGAADDLARAVRGLGGRRAEYLGEQVRAMRTLAGRLAGEELSLPELVAGCMGLDAGWLPETVFEEAHDLLDRGLPKGEGTLAERLHAWQRAHTLPSDRKERVPELVGVAVAETRARTSRMIIPLPEDEQVTCELVPGAAFLAAGHHRGGTASTIYVNADAPFNLADLLYVVAHEGHPGHIAEQVLKEVHLQPERPEQQVRMLLSPAFVISEGLGLWAQDILFPGGEAQEWLLGAVEELTPDGSDYALIHTAKTILWGVLCNAALLAAEGRSREAVADYLRKWALADDPEVEGALNLVCVPGGQPYVFAYYHGWRLVRPWASDPARVRRLLTEHVPLGLLTAA
ncbi:hypothetical protein HNP84_003328 [Thermocatellispora tengchongensis]|uniref:DUF885 domain-containing protein n=1 Tax=Thermocatellispora tengchongensis TaxID=1073253 RepID=A0A840P2L4_9ACTN|nr:hypothetical protein [Thermocatellispora tengchongensis]MBB5133602.1 hypothetical protein [Thermocatellispora tengchongensis]